MAHSIAIDSKLSKEDKYLNLLPQVKALVSNETDLIANLANTAAALYEAMGFFWVGFYQVKEGQLVLAPFQGPVACTRIPFAKGVCGAAYRRKETIIVEDVNKFEGHIACSSTTLSEIVLPAIKNGKVIFVLDVDSDKLNTFDEIDKKYLEEIVQYLVK